MEGILFSLAVGLVIGGFVQLIKNNFYLGEDEETEDENGI